MKSTTNKLELYQSLTSMKSLSYSIISYGIFYGIKQAAFVYTLFSYLISNEYLRLIPSLFFGYFISRAMLDISSNISEKKEWVIVSISAFDFLILFVITDVLRQDNWINITNLLIFCAFVTYLGFWLNKVFVDRVKQERKKTNEKQKIASTEQKIAEVKRDLARSTEELAKVNNNIVNKEQTLESMEQEIADRSCPYCHAPFPNSRSRNAHKGVCPENPNRKEKTKN
ncbi:hypothetical protein V2647_14625 [Tenacibaculum maritimum]|uniref:hypothetical protein n=1 Tax=Tenacibaculum maritimum TaxID=107401 RepID=UPI00387679F3